MTTVTGMVPAAAISAAGTAAVNIVDETNVVARSMPFHCTFEPSTKFVPFTVRVKDSTPVKEEDGLKLLITGTGLFTVVLAVVLLFAGLGSDELLLVMLAVLVKPETATIGVTTNVTVALSPLLIEPRAQVTVLVPMHVP